MIKVTVDLLEVNLQKFDILSDRRVNSNKYIKIIVKCNIIKLVKIVLHLTIILWDLVSVIKITLM